MPTIGHPFELLSELDSTSNYIADHPQLADMSEGTAILTYNQSKGRGQRMRAWDSEKGKDLTVSYLFRPRITPDRAFAFNKLIAMALRACVAQLVDEDVKIKWPNDIYVNGLKVAGILIEPSWQGSYCRHMIVGIGINVNSKRANGPWPATSLMENTGHELELMDVFKNLNHQLQVYYSRLLEESETEVSEAFDHHLLCRNEKVDIISNGHRQSVIILGVDPYGRLRVLEGDVAKNYPHGEVEIDYSRIKGK